MPASVDAARLKRLYIEITNRCNLTCPFCPGPERPPRDMSAAEFSRALTALAGASGQVYLHVMGEPLLHPALDDILALCRNAGRSVNLTTNGVLLPGTADALLSAPALRQVNVSLHCAEGWPDERADRYFESVLDFAARARRRVLVALRLWTGGGHTAARFRAALQARFPSALAGRRHGCGAWTLDDGLFLGQAEAFDWPDRLRPGGSEGFCLGLRRQLAVLSDGTVCPCCLDRRGDAALGNLFEQSLDDILSSPRARALVDGFSARTAVEPLCRGCTYKSRF